MVPNVRTAPQLGSPLPKQYQPPVDLKFYPLPSSPFQSSSTSSSSPDEIMQASNQVDKKKKKRKIKKKKNKQKANQAFIATDVVDVEKYSNQP